MAADELRIGPMGAGDIPEIMELEKGILSAWSRSHLENELQQPAGFRLVARSKDTGKLLGIVCGRIAADEAEILKLSIAEYIRQQGVGSQLLDSALDHCRARGVKSCYLELRSSNRAASRLYEKQGFMQVGVRKNYYENPCEDAIMMHLDLR